ncbi:formylglycine-generating enzyme family protein [Cylindrospermum sp. FACHB-282]|uniref:formylglycine-generating enzyme family protein n=1 Tax=Cylindrospermum sp. FACHB-282 TaxID=2692794 RepID=UPI0016890380|nr:formylglycine-generating enzyme family protein [Cylindrospermum sp. FACHB-282]MBD2383913.1 formylglycine-generating enzyme family protein [Cylindrospermum sp. FACHB-282]
MSKFEFEVVTIADIEKTGFLDIEASQVKTISCQGRVDFRVEDLENGVSLELVAIPGGEFVMGSPNDEEWRNWYGNAFPSLRDVNVEGPQHRVVINPLWMSKYPVTQAQWRAVAALPKVERDLDPEPSNFQGSRHPVESIFWSDAVEFCDRLSQKTGQQYQLPSESQWEYACRGGTTTPFYFGETITTELGNYRGTDWRFLDKTYPGFYGRGDRGIYRQQTTEVGIFPPNPFGLYDMHGNVWEWCLDHWHDNYQGAPTDGSAWVTGGDDSCRIVRGGSWPYFPGLCRSATRHKYALGIWHIGIGFRIVCST